ncbi:uncharacterized protein BO96DRAFT_344969, partial [Aspergillus niger CBS 101883]
VYHPGSKHTFGSTTIVILPYHRSLPEVLEDTCRGTLRLRREIGKETIGQDVLEDQCRRCDCTRTCASEVPDFLGYAIRITLTNRRVTLVAYGGYTSLHTPGLK